MWLVSVAPFFSQVLVFRCGEQIELSFSQQREVVESGIDRITRQENNYIAYSLVWIVEGL